MAYPRFLECSLLVLGTSRTAALKFPGDLEMLPGGGGAWEGMGDAMDSTS